MTDKQSRPTRASVRRLLNELFPLETELRAFCIDHFPSVAREGGDGMPRSTRLSLLLQKECPAYIFDAIQEHLRLAAQSSISSGELKSRLVWETDQRSAMVPKSQRKKFWLAVLLTNIANLLLRDLLADPWEKIAAYVQGRWCQAKRQAQALVGTSEWRQISAGLLTLVTWILTVSLVFLRPSTDLRPATPTVELQSADLRPNVSGVPQGDRNLQRRLGDPNPVSMAAGQTFHSDHDTVSSLPPDHAPKRNDGLTPGPSTATPATTAPKPSTSSLDKELGLPNTSRVSQVQPGLQPRPEKLQPTSPANRNEAQSDAQAEPERSQPASPTSQKESPRPRQTSPVEEGARAANEAPSSGGSARPPARLPEAMLDEDASTELQRCKSSPLPRQLFLAASRSRPQLEHGRRLVADRYRGYVCIPPYAISTDPVTQGAYAVLMGGQPQKGEYMPNRPVLVSYMEAAHFCNAMSEREGLSLCYEFSEENGRETVAWRNRSHCTGYRLPAVEEAAAYHRGTDNEWTWVTNTPSIDQIEVHEGIPRGFYIARSLNRPRR